MIHCPSCSAVWVKDSDIHPEPGDPTICGGCGRVLRFTRSILGGPLRLSLLSDRDERALRRAVRERLRDLQPGSQ